MKKTATAILLSGMLLFIIRGGGRAQVAPATAADTDGDGIPDYYETNGIQITYQGSQPQHMDLSSSPTHKDVFVFYAWMAVPGGHTHQPLQNMNLLPDNTYVDKVPLGRVIDAFKASPGTNPDGVTGITLHLIPVANPEITETPNLVQLGGLIGNDPNAPYDWSAFEALKERVFPTVPQEVASAFHFCLFAHQLGGGLGNISGISRTIPGSDFIVSLGSGQNQVGTSDDQVGTFMHELGHTLGLRHGGVDDVNYKPNYPSVMNYLFQFIGTIRSGQEGVFDYSPIGVNMDENALNDSVGITQDDAFAGFGSAYLCDSQASRQKAIFSFNDPVSWENCDAPPGSNRTIAFDVNRDTLIANLTGQNDWAHVMASAAAAGAPVPGPMTEPTSLSGVSQTLSLQPRIDATRSGKDVQLHWSQIPLERVQGYQVLRQSGTGALSPLVITRKTTSTDHDAPGGPALSYRVRLLVEVPAMPPTSAVTALTVPGRTMFGAAAPTQRLAYGPLSAAAVVQP